LHRRGLRLIVKYFEWKEAHIKYDKRISVSRGRFCSRLFVLHEARDFTGIES
jgi:hypothetical protein